MVDLDARTVLEGDAVFTDFKGALAEQFVCQELVASVGVEPFYWSASGSQGEIDFLVQWGSDVYPIEVKAEENLRAKSLSAFSKRYPDFKPLWFSLSNYREESWMRNIPLYALAQTRLWG